MINVRERTMIEGRGGHCAGSAPSMQVRTPGPEKIKYVPNEMMRSHRLLEEKRQCNKWIWAEPLYILLFACF